MSGRRLLRAFHRWFGAALCLLFAIWFASGIVLTFAGFPSVSERERLTHAPALQADSLRVPPATALSAIPRSVDSVVIEALESRALYKVRSESGTLSFAADDGRQLALLDDRTAISAVSAWVAGAPVDSARLDEVDQWTPQANRHGELPCLRLRVRDAAGSELYVSLVDGDVLQKTTRETRFLAWIGAIPHWIYPIQLRRHGGAWRVLVIALSGLGALTSAAGLLHGLSVARLARRTSRGRRLTLTPFRDRSLAWHHRLGLAFGVLSFSWVLSGMLSFYPFARSAEMEPTPADVAAFRGAAFDPRSFRREPRAALLECQTSLGSAIKRLELVRAGGAPYYLCKNAEGTSRIVSADPSAPSGTTLQHEEIARIARGLGGGAAVKSEAWLSEGDAYYYPSHFEPDLPFPILRTQFSSGLTTYVSPETLSVVRRFSTSGALYRWVYHGLHSLDVPFLYRRSWLWHPLIVLLLLAGGALALSGAWLGARWATRGSFARTTRRLNSAPDLQQARDP